MIKEKTLMISISKVFECGRYRYPIGVFTVLN
jgi:hypothetical protein